MSKSTDPDREAKPQRRGRRLSKKIPRIARELGQQSLFAVLASNGPKEDALCRLHLLSQKLRREAHADLYGDTSELMTALWKPPMDEASCVEDPGDLASITDAEVADCVTFNARMRRWIRSAACAAEWATAKDKAAASGQ